MKCTSCHASNYDGAKYCWKCKKPLVEGTPYPADDDLALVQADIIANLEVTKDEEKHFCHICAVIPIIMVLPSISLYFLVPKDISYKVTDLYYLVPKDCDFAILMSLIGYALIYLVFVMINFAVLDLFKRRGKKISYLGLYFGAPIVMIVILTAMLGLMNLVASTSMLLAVIIGLGTYLGLIIYGIFAWRKERKFIQNLDNQIQKMWAQ